ncbi:cell division protein FtsB [Paucidesulfovibrio gracilis DSM 16080]|uniref:Cell division protein FtsB n=1 Tax=Paucidesulfovibrio gracilis DSM 16080 TaxID=1121449 RepID=A0A1T4WS40_9BACT|nr:septum formation initiator family protein [Paucidesulfovibrio gracilis]SKA80144.1 cell division protein FtsB [Paucidesulfovibrio gracilis DSM 16080]
MFGRRVIVGLLVLLNAYLLLGLIWGERGVVSYWDLKSRYQLLRSEVQNLETHSRDLSRDILRLESDADYQERMIRERMNYVRDSEILYVFPESETKPGDGLDAAKN